MTTIRPAHRATPRLSTRDLLVCAVFATAGALLVVAISPVTGVLAVVSPLAYAAVASVSATGTLLAVRWTRAPGAAVVTALTAGLIAAAFTPFAAITLGALLLPALAMELAFAACRYRFERRRTWVIGPAAGGLVIGVASLPIINPTLLTPGFIAAVIAIRIVAYIGAGALSAVVFAGLQRAGIRPPRKSEPGIRR